MVIVWGLISNTAVAQTTQTVVSEKTSRAYLQKFVCLPKQDCFLYFEPYDVEGMTIQAVCNDCFLDWQRTRKDMNEINLNHKLALIRTDLQPYRDTGKNWYVVKWFTLIN